MRHLILGFTTLIAACNPANAPDPSTRSDILEAMPTEPALALTCYREQGYAMLAAHRGGPAPGYPENALTSLARLAEMGVLYAEIDVRETADHVLVLLHDETLDRTTTGTGLLADHSWSELQEIALRDDQGHPVAATIPTLAEALDLATETGLVLNLDLKTVSPDVVIEAVHAADARDHVAIIAYTVEDAARIHALDPGLVLSVPDDIPALAAAGVNLEASYIWLGTGPLQADRDQALADQGLESSVGLFRREDGTDVPYLEAAGAGIELLSIDNVEAAVAALGGSEALHARIAHCQP